MIAFTIKFFLILGRSLWCVNDDDEGGVAEHCIFVFGFIVIEYYDYLRTQLKDGISVMVMDVRRGARRGWMREMDAGT